ncbi:MAG: hypothetical protein ACR2RV_02880 [Verrucomicrobiales bacterium]
MSAIWLVSVLLAFGLGLAGGRAMRTVAPRHDPALERLKTPLRSAVPAPGLDNQKLTIEQPAIAARIGILERLTTIGLAELPGLVRQLMDERVAPGNLTDVTPAMDRWIELDPAGGFAFFASEYPEKPDSDCLSAFCARWARVDPDAAFETVSEFVPDRRAKDCVNSIEMTIATLDPAEFFRRVDLSRDQNYHVAHAGLALALKDPQAAIAILPRLGESQRHGLTGEIAFGWAINDPDAAAGWARELDHPMTRARALHAIAAALITTDPERAAKVYQEGDQSQAQSSGTQPGPYIGYYGESYDWGAIAAKLARTDPAAAFEWAQPFTDQHNLVSTVMNCLPPSASATVDFLAALPAEIFAGAEGGQFPGAREGWEPPDLDEGLAKLSEIADPGTRQMAHAWLLSEQARDRPQSAISAAGEQISSPALRAPVLENALASWVIEDPTGASAWLAEQEPGSDRDAGISGLLEVSRIAEPAAAIGWASAISDPETRISHLLQIFTEQPRDWAVSTFESLELSDDERNRIKPSLQLD